MQNVGTRCGSRGGKGKETETQGQTHGHGRLTAKDPPGADGARTASPGGGVKGEAGVFRLIFDQRRKGALVGLLIRQETRDSRREWLC